MAVIERDLELKRLLAERDVAQQHFDHADPAYVDAAHYKLKAAEEALNVYLKARKAGSL